MLHRHLGIFKSYTYNISMHCLHLMHFCEIACISSVFWVMFSQDAASLTNAILKKKFRARVFLGCDNHPLSRWSSCHRLCLTTLPAGLKVNHSFCLCRQEIMDLVNKSGKFSDKFEAFTGISISKSIFSSSWDLTYIWLSSSQVLMVHWVKEWTILNLV